MTDKQTISQEKTMQLQQVFDLYDRRLRLVEDKIRELFGNRASIIPAIGNHIISSGGKRLRPLFHLLSADLAGYNGDKDITVGGIIESIHTASLLHDDIVDMADIRRGKPTANSVWGNQVVVLVGDFLYSNALRTAVLLKSQKIMETLSEATTRMTEGELLQLSRIGDMDITEDEYREIISAKTGALISAACRVGAVLGDLEEEKELALAEFGMKTGIAFQMADDILDYMADESELGKKLGKDLEEGKITLPLIHLLQAADPDEVAEIKEILTGDSTEAGVRNMLILLRKYRSIESSFAKAEALVGEACEALSVFPDCSAREGLLAIAAYSLHRGK